MSSFYGSGRGQGRKQRTAAARILAGSMNSSVSTPYAPGMRLSDNPGIQLNEFVHNVDFGDFSDSEGEESIRETQEQAYFSPYQHHSFSSGEGGHSSGSTPNVNPERELMITPVRGYEQDGARRSTGNVVALVQKQQDMLQKVIAAQETMTKKQEAIETQLHKLQDNIETLESPESINHSGKRKRTVTLSLSVSVIKLPRQSL